jgi:hypothetical protein
MTDDSCIQIYQSPDGETQVDVRFEHETVWLTQAQMVELFHRDVSVISRHIKNAAELKQALALIQKAAKSPALATDMGWGLVDIMGRYTTTFLWLQRYDEGLLKEPGGFPGGILPTPKAAMAAILAPAAVQIF